MNTRSKLWLVLMYLFVAANGEAQFTYRTNGGTITITGYRGTGGVVTIPSAINGLPVTVLGPAAFRENNRLTEVTIPDSVIAIGSQAFCNCSRLISVNVGNGVKSIGSGAFLSCPALSRVIFTGDAPVADTTTFGGNIGTSVFYMPSSAGWKS